MAKERRLWPSADDKGPITEYSTVPRSPLVASNDDVFIPGSHCFEVKEDSEAVETRLREQFPVYKVVQFGKDLLRIGEKNEV